MAILAETVARLLIEDAVHSSHNAVEIDDTVVVSLFASLDPDDSNAHVPQTLGVKFSTPGEAMAQLYSAFEAEKGKFCLQNPRSFPATALSIKNVLVRDRERPYFRRLPPSALETLKWCISAYALTINAESSIRLGRFRMGPDLRPGFSLIARRHISKGSTIWEALGICPHDNEAAHSELSCITTATGQDQAPGSERILYGPLRMLNHRCLQFNTEYVFVDNTSAFVAEALVDIEPGTELTANYGPDWFQGQCPCIDCAPAVKPDERGQTSNLSHLLPITALPSMRSRYTATLKRKPSVTSETTDPTASDLITSKQSKKARRQRIKRINARREKAEGEATDSKSPR